MAMAIGLPWNHTMNIEEFVIRYHPHAPMDKQNQVENDLHNGLERCRVSQAINYFTLQKIRSFNVRWRAWCTSCSNPEPSPCCTFEPAATSTSPHKLN